ncbi:MAG: phosphohydrolase, partial [Christensenellaceae bacterium]|nr:phosphohydrolase [Christensenellaceae bacterium]
CWLIAHHHTFTHVDGMDHRILLEADFLVNIFEGGFDRAQVDSIRKKVFVTRAGKHFLDHMFYAKTEQGGN